LPPRPERLFGGPPLMEATQVFCGGCGVELVERTDAAPGARPPCSVCGSVARSFKAQFTGTVKLRSKFAMKAKTKGERRPFVEQKVSDELFRKTGRWHRVRRVIDRRGGRYFEHIEDAETGHEVRHVDEPLRAHSGRGSARRKPV